MSLHSSFVHLRDVCRATEHPGCDALLSAYRTEHPSDCWSPGACDVHGEKSTSLNRCRDSAPRHLNDNGLSFRESRQRRDLVDVKTLHLIICKSSVYGVFFSSPQTNLERVAINTDSFKTLLCLYDESYVNFGTEDVLLMLDRSFWETC